MSKKCDMVRDMMPLCIDGTASESTRCYVEGHVSGCVPCKTVYAEMKSAVEIDTPPENEVFARAVKTMQNRRKRRTWRSVLVGMVIALAAAVLLATGYGWWFAEEQFVAAPDRMTFSFSQTDDAGPMALMYATSVPRGAELRITVKPQDPDGDGVSQYTAYLAFYATRAELRNEEAGINYIIGSVQDGRIYMSDYGEGPVQIERMIYGTVADGGRVVYLTDTEMETVSLFGLTVKTPDHILWTDTARNNAVYAVNGSGRDAVVYATITPMATLNPTPEPMLNQDRAIDALPVVTAPPMVFPQPSPTPTPSPIPQ